MEYDIIGDIHGHHDELVALLKKLGYRESAGAWRHASRQAIFVGDFIDRGPRQLATLNTVRSMVDVGAALAIMGNHEFNAMAWYTEDPDKPGEYLRPRIEKNQNQHEAFLTEIKDHANLHKSWVEWFYTLPIWLDLPGLRVVHACWHPASMKVLEPMLNPDHTLTPSLLVAASRKDVPEFVAAETLLKGVEIKLPQGQTFRDKEKNERDAARIRWWDPAAITYRQAAITGSNKIDLPDEPIPEHLRVTYDDAKPVFFGHYWRPGTPRIETPSAACVDFSVAKKGGVLAAYRWSGESALNDANYISVRRLAD